MRTKVRKRFAVDVGLLRYQLIFFEAFRKACEFNHAEIVQILLEHPKVDIHARGNYAFHMAVRCCSAQVVKVLTSHPKFRVNVGVCSTMFHEICYQVPDKNGNVAKIAASTEIVKTLMDFVGEGDLVSECERAISRDCYHLVRVLISDERYWCVMYVYRKNTS
jgi:hypothetical protein